MPFQKIARRAIGLRHLSDADIDAVTSCPDERLPELMQAARQVRSEFFGDRVELCAIVNARSGRCPENCSFCAQSAHHDTGCDEYPLIDPEAVGRAAREAREGGATRFGVVISGTGLETEEADRFAACVRAVAEAGLEPDASPGIVSRTLLRDLKKAGLRGYHHNLETAASYFDTVCTTHAYEEDVQAVRDAIKEGLYVCSGGIFGLGEGFEHRVELALTLRDLGVPSVPVNFLTPVPGTALEDRPVMSSGEALRTLALMRFLLPDRQVRVCGGRPSVFAKGSRSLPFKAGITGVMTGDYLTTPGEGPRQDVDRIRRAGLTPGPHQQGEDNRG
ncbi:biotin synthase BioB [Salidesulfovibrio brasiliensis]